MRIINTLLQKSKFAIVGVMLLTLISKFLGFIKELILAYCFGASSITDAYLISQTIPGTLFVLVGTGISTCFVPIYLSKKANNKEESLCFVDKFLSMIICVSLVLICIINIFVHGIVRIFAIGFDPDTLVLAERFTRINSISLVFSAFVYVLTAFLNSEKAFFSTALSVIPYNLGLIFAIWAGAQFELYALSYVSVIAVVLQMVYLLQRAKKTGYNFSPNLCWLKDRDIKQSLSLLPPVVLGVAATEINILIDRSLASVLLVGGITIVTYGTSLFNLLVGVFAQPISTVFFPTIAEAAATNDKKAVSDCIEKALSFLMFLMIPLTLGVVVVADELVNTFFLHGQFNQSDAALLSKVLVLYAIGMIAYGIRQVISNAFYSLKMTKQPMINTIIGVAINILLNLFFGSFMGINGLALATSLSTILICVSLILSFKRVVKCSFFPKPKQLGKYLLSATLMLLCCLIIDQWVLLSDLFSLLLIVIVGVTVYFGLTWVMHVNPFMGKATKNRQ